MKRPFFKPKLYLSARISQDAHAKNNMVASYLADSFDVFLPHEYQVCNGPHEEIGISVYNQDMGAMEQSDLAVLVPPYGRDCSFEVGWYVGANKPVFVFVEDEMDWLRDVMVKGGITAVLTSNEKTYRRLMEDPILRFTVRFVSNRWQLGQTILEIYDDLKNGQVLMEHA